MVALTQLTLPCDLLRWIPLLPLAGSAINLFFGGRMGKTAAGLLASSAVAASFAIALWVFYLLPNNGIFRDLVYTWIESGSFKVNFALQADALTAVMLLVVTGIGFLIHLYSLGYMEHDTDMVRFFVYLNLFLFFMLLLVMGDNLLLLFVGWEGVGLCSYLLIGFWYRDQNNAIAGNKAFIVNRIGDFGFVLGIFLLVAELARQGVWTLDFVELEKHVKLLSPIAIGAITLLLFVGATGKSAQIPLFVWLPDAMAGPTPVSALIHAATMVTAGVYMTARLHFLFELAPGTLHLIAWVGAATAIFAATIALTQTDIKRVLAYSTVSQLGYMFLAVGVGAFSAAVFHLFTHAFFKACLFLGSGSVIHAMGGEQDMRKMGGLKEHMPRTYWTYVVATLAIAGAPFTAGFFSKDLILWQAYSSAHGSGWLWVVGWLTAGLTAFYMFRQLFMVFHGTCRADAKTKAHLHESPEVMTEPLIILAIGSIFTGWLGAPEYLWGSRWDKWLAPIFGAHEGAHHSVQLELGLMCLTLAIIAVGVLLAYRFYYKSSTAPDSLAALAGGAPYRLSFNKYYIDELYDFFIVQPFTAISSFFARFFDPWIIDGIVNGVGASARGLSSVWRGVQTGNVQHYLAAFLIATLALLAYFLRQQ
ncbi:MAG: NADH-quinone oxidoreductase subunit L [Deltaproteobacteria bacterium]|nr:NADH-quinone oxidoreductase subunit L [Deltaproteobacteria bacterium]